MAPLGVYICKHGIVNCKICPKRIEAGPAEPSNQLVPFKTPGSSGQNNPFRPPPGSNKLCLIHAPRKPITKMMDHDNDVIQEGIEFVNRFQARQFDAQKEEAQQIIAIGKAQEQAIAARESDYARVRKHKLEMQRKYFDTVHDLNERQRLQEEMLEEMGREAEKERERVRLEVQRQRELSLAEVQTETNKMEVLRMQRKMEGEQRRMEREAKVAMEKELEDLRRGMERERKEEEVTRRDQVKKDHLGKLQEMQEQLDILRKKREEAAELARKEREKQKIEEMNRRIEHAKLNQLEREEQRKRNEREREAKLEVDRLEKQKKLQDTLKALDDEAKKRRLRAELEAQGREFEATQNLLTGEERLQKMQEEHKRRKEELLKKKDQLRLENSAKHPLLVKGIKKDDEEREKLRLEDAKHVQERHKKEEEKKNREEQKRRDKEKADPVNGKKEQKEGQEQKRQEEEKRKKEKVDAERRGKEKKEREERKRQEQKQREKDKADVEKRKKEQKEREEENRQEEKVKEKADAEKCWEEKKKENDKNEELPREEKVVKADKQAKLQQQQESEKYEQRIKAKADEEKKRDRARQDDLKAEKQVTQKLPWKDIDVAKERNLEQVRISKIYHKRQEETKGAQEKAVEIEKVHKRDVERLRAEKAENAMKEAAKKVQESNKPSIPKVDRIATVIQSPVARAAPTGRPSTATTPKKDEVIKQSKAPMPGQQTCRHFKIPEDCESCKKHLVVKK